jgi:hypothetical protein
MIRKTPVALLLLACLLTVSGCFILPMEPKSKGPATDQYRLEMEFLSNVSLVSEDTSPWWDLGRHAYKKGTDRLIVIGRTTSYADKNEDNEPIEGTLRDRKLERVWITIPSDVPLGKALKLEELEVQFLTGYDVNNLDSKGFFKGPHLMKGFVNLIDEGPDKVSVVFDIEIRPNRPFQAENWKVEGKHTIKVVPDGKIATIAVSRDVQVGAAPATPAGTGDGVATPPAVPATPVAVPTLSGENKTNDNTTTPAVAKTDEPKVESRAVTGKWMYETPGMDFRFQFGDNGKFILSHGRGDGVSDTYAPCMNYGTYQIKKTKTAEWLVMVVDRCEFDGTSAMKDFYPENKTIMMKMEWENDNLVLRGTLPILKNKDTKFVCRAGDFQDMNKVLPPKGRRKNDPGEVNNKPYW